MVVVMMYALIAHGPLFSKYTNFVLFVASHVILDLPIRLITGELKLSVGTRQEKWERGMVWFLLICTMI